MRNGCVITSNVKVQLSFLRDVEEIQQKRAKAGAEARTCAGSQDTEVTITSMIKRNVTRNKVYYYYALYSYLLYLVLQLHYSITTMCY